MLCDVCGERDATIIYTELVDGEQRVRHLCPRCALSLTGMDAHKFAVLPGSLLAGMLSELIQKFQRSGELDEQEMKKTNFVCPVCKTTYNEFLKYGTLGCRDCYRTFGLILDPCLDEMHGAHQHVGEPPVGLDTFIDIPELKPMPVIEHTEEIELVKEEDELAGRLKAAIEVEDFEEAARLRDLIRDKKVQDKEVALDAE